MIVRILFEFIGYIFKASWRYMKWFVLYRKTDADIMRARRNGEDHNDYPDF